MTNAIKVENYTMKVRIIFYQRCMYHRNKFHTKVFLEIKVASEIK